MNAVNNMKVDIRAYTWRTTRNVFPAGRFLRALPCVIAARRQPEMPLGNRWQFQGQSQETGRARSSGSVRNVGGIDDLFLFDRPAEDRTVTERVYGAGDASGATEDLHPIVV